MNQITNNWILTCIKLGIYIAQLAYILYVKLVFLFSYL